MYQLHSDVVEKLRGLRWKLDQRLESIGLEPVFKDMYYAYTREEFLLSGMVDYHKIKTLLSRASSELKKDPEIGPHLEEIHDLLKKVELLEETTPAYFSADGTYHWSVVPAQTKQRTAVRRVKVPRAPDEDMPLELDMDLEEELDTPRSQGRTTAVEEKLRLIAEIKMATETMAQEGEQHTDASLPPGRPQKKKHKVKRHVIVGDARDAATSDKASSKG
jgi:hypothetical protein